MDGTCSLFGGRNIFYTGLIAQAEQVAQELRWSYPDSEWMKKAMAAAVDNKEG